MIATATLIYHHVTTPRSRKIVARPAELPEPKIQIQRRILLHLSSRRQRIRNKAEIVLHNAPRVQIVEGCFGKIPV